MRTTHIVLGGLVGCLVLGASGPAQNRVIRNNQPVLVLSGAACGGGPQYNLPSVNPPGYAPGAGSVAPDTWSWRVIDNNGHDRGAGSQVDGFTMVMRQSACSGGNWLFDYQAQTELWGTVPRAGGGLDPDSSTVLVGVAQMPLVSPGLDYRVTISFPPVTVPPGGTAGAFGGYAVATKFAGGENDGFSTGHGNVATWMDGPTPYETAGFQDASGVITYNTDSQFKTWLTFTEAEPTISMFSDWGRRRVPVPPLGHSIGTYYSDLATVGQGVLGFSFRAAASPNALVLPLLNFAGSTPPYNLATPWPVGAGALASLDLDPNDPVLLMLAHSVSFQLDGRGEYDQGVTAGPPPFALNGGPALVGTWLGFEGLLFDSATFLFLGDTQGVWIDL